MPARLLHLGLRGRDVLGEAAWAVLLGALGALLGRWPHRAAAIELLVEEERFQKRTFERLFCRFRRHVLRFDDDKVAGLALPHLEIGPISVIDAKFFACRLPEFGLQGVEFVRLCRGDRQLCEIAYCKGSPGFEFLEPLSE